jgi:branched-subunit amino acid transport protein
VLVGGGLTYLFRLVPAALVDRIEPLMRLERASGFTTPVTFAAVAAGGVSARCTAAGGTVALAPLGAVVVADAAVRRTGSSHVGIAAGMPTLWVLDLVLR